MVPIANYIRVKKIRLAGKPECPPYELDLPSQPPKPLPFHTNPDPLIENPGTPAPALISTSSHAGMERCCQYVDLCK